LMGYLERMACPGLSVFQAHPEKQSRVTSDLKGHMDLQANLVGICFFLK
jgi:hypothetical protein